MDPGVGAGWGDMCCGGGREREKKRGEVRERERELELIFDLEPPHYINT